MNRDIKNILEGVKSGTLSVEDAALELKMKPFEDIGYANVDLHRKVRQGAAEVIYGSGKTPEQIIGTIDVRLKNSGDTILVTRIDEDKAKKYKSITK